MAYTIRQYQTKSGKRYEVRYRKPDGTDTGKRGFKRKMDADAWGAANVTTAKSVGAYIDPQAGRRLVEDFWEPWLAAKKTKAKPSYIKSLEDAWRVHVEPQWGMREMQSITRDEVQRWVTDLAGRRSASVTIRAENLLRSLMERAKADRCIHDNPCDGIELPRKQVRKHVYLSADELSRVAMQCGWREPIDFLFTAPGASGRTDGQRLESDAARWVVRGGASPRGRRAWPHDDSRSAAYRRFAHGAVRR